MTNYLITKVEGGYEVVDPAAPGARFHVTKPNGKMHCDCPDYRNAPKGTCDHIATIIDRFRKPAAADQSSPVEPAGNGTGPGSQGGREQPASSEAQSSIPELEKGLVAWHLEYPFRPEQIITGAVSTVFNFWVSCRVPYLSELLCDRGPREIVAGKVVHKERPGHDGASEPNGSPGRAFRGRPVRPACAKPGVRAHADSAPAKTAGASSAFTLRPRLRFGPGSHSRGPAQRAPVHRSGRPAGWR